MKKMRVRVYVKGRVQGVFFRETTRQRAETCGVNGWVKNLHDGRVEAVFEGEANAVEQLLSFVNEGPLHAFVSKVRRLDEDYEGTFDSFTIVG